MPGGLQLRAYIEPRLGLSEWVQLMALALQAQAIEYALRLRSPEARFLAGRIYGLGDAVQNRLWFHKLNCVLYTREATFDRAREHVIQSAFGLYKTERQAGKKHMDACREVLRTPSFQRACKDYGKTFTLPQLRKMIERRNRSDRY